MLREHNRKHWIRKFLTAFILTIIGIIAFAGGVYAALRFTLIRPPQLPAYVEVRVPVAQSPPPIVTPPPAVNPPSADIIYEETPEPDLPYAPLPEPEPEPEYETIVFHRRDNFFTFMFYGLDNGNNVDAIMVASFCADTNQAHIISLPRDTRVEADRIVGRRKLVASYHAGRTGGGGHDGGIRQMKDEVESLIGFRPDFYIGVNQRAFVRLIDAIGGVEVTIPFRLVYNDPYQNLHIDLAPGTRVLNGAHALHFARFRQFNQGCPHFRHYSDFQRMQAQQQIINSALNELLSVRTVTRIPELVRIYREHVNTNLSPFEIAWFVELAPGINPRTLLTTYTLPIARTERRGWYEVPDAGEVLALVNRTINPFTRDITPEMLRIVE